MEDTFPDLGSLSDTELKELIDKLTEEEEKVSYQRRILHGKIDILRAELVNRLRKKREEGESVISGADVQQLTDILAGKALGDDDRSTRADRSDRRPRHRGKEDELVHCPECGFINTPGRQLLPEVRRSPGADEEQGDQTTITYKVGETGELQAGRRRGGGRRGRRARDPLGRRPRGGELLARGRAHHDRPQP